MKISERRRPQTSKTYNRKLSKLKRWHAKREEARKSWSQERLDKAKPLQPLAWYVERLREFGKEVKTKTTNTARPKKTWW